VNGQAYALVPIDPPGPPGPAPTGPGDPWGPEGLTELSECLASMLREQTLDTLITDLEDNIHEMLVFWSEG